MVGHLTLDQQIGVRIPAPQLSNRGKLLVMRYIISPKDLTVARKYNLGIPIRKYQLHPTHSFYTSSPLLFAK